MGLRKGQKELVEQYRKGYCAVPAIPGGGKTYALSQWVVEMIAEGRHQPGKILIVTYMNSAVNNFKQRIGQELEKRGLDPGSGYFVSTIHGLCLQIIKERPDAVNLPEEFLILDDVIRRKLLEEAVHMWTLKNPRLFEACMDDALREGSSADRTLQMWKQRLGDAVSSAISDFKCRGIRAAEAASRCSSLPDVSMLRWAADIYMLYDTALHLQGAIDFDDMLYHSKLLLERDADLLERFRSRYPLVCEDEAQDSNRIQTEILSRIANGNFLRVGDSNQAICGTFTSSDPALFHRFCRQPDTQVYHITQSSRSTRQIIALANHLVWLVRQKHPILICRESLLEQYIEPVKEDDAFHNPVTEEYGIHTAVFSSWEAETAGVAEQIAQLCARYPDKTMAVLAPAAYKIDLLAERLQNRGIPCDLLDNSAEQRNYSLRALGAALDFVYHPYHPDTFCRLIPYLCRSNSQKEKRKMEDCWEKALLEYVRRERVENILYPLPGIPPLPGLPPSVERSWVGKEWHAIREVVCKLLELPIHPPEKWILHTAQLLQFDRQELAVACKVASDARFMAAADPGWSMKQLLEELMLRKNRFTYFAGVVWELEGYEPVPGTVTLCTYHKAKGLEWDIVFLTSITHSDFPVGLHDRFQGEYWYLKSEYKNPQAVLRAELCKLLGENDHADPVTQAKLETIAERTRLLYVGITRARRYLYMSAHEANAGKKNEILPSKYLRQLRRYIEEAEKKWKV